MDHVLLEYGSEYRRATELEGHHVAPSFVTRMINTDTRMFSPRGRTIALVLHKRIPAELQQRAFQVFSAVDDSVEHRPQAAGTRGLPIRTNKDGRLSKFRGANENVLAAGHPNARQGILGWQNGTVKHQEMLNACRELIERVDRHYRHHLPDVYERQKSAARKLPFQMWRTPFTTAYIARNFRTACHYDSGNLRGAFTVILPLGDFSGGELVLPRWRIGFAYKPGDVLFFDPQELHGNLPITGKRISVALYCSAFAKK